MEIEGIKTKFSASLLTLELGDFLRSLREVLRGVKKQASLCSMEKWVLVDIVSQSHGHMQASGFVSPSDNTKVSFMFESDQSMVEALVNDLGNIELDFPIRGRRKV